MRRQDSGALRRGWTTGACAAAGARAAFAALLTGRFPDPVLLRLPRSRAASLPLALSELDEDHARAGILEDAGDDPDITHGTLIVAEVARAPAGSGIGFCGRRRRRAGHAPRPTRRRR